MAASAHAIINQTILESPHPPGHNYRATIVVLSLLGYDLAVAYFLSLFPELVFGQNEQKSDMGSVP